MQLLQQLLAQNNMTVIFSPTRLLDFTAYDILLSLKMKIQLMKWKTDNIEELQKKLQKVLINRNLTEQHTTKQSTTKH